jgi:Flp pilus assembly protein TadD
MTSPSARNFVFAFAATVGFCVLAIVGLNVIVDPFWRFDLATIEGLNLQRTQFPSTARLGKPGVVCRMQPTKAILGTSRAEVGLDPRHPGFNTVPGKTYNLALAGLGAGELLATLKHAKFASPNLKQVVIALDFFMFNANREAVVFGTEVLDFDPDRLLHSASDTCLRVFLHDFDRLVWTRGVRYSIATVVQQIWSPEKGPRTQNQYIRWMNLYDQSGYRGDFFSVRARDFERIGSRVVVDGPPAHRVAAQERYYSVRVWRPPPTNRYCFTAPGQPDTLDIFREILRFGHQTGLDIRFAINPIHARMLVALRDIGLWPLYEDWKRKLVEANETEAQAAGAAPFPLWDFSGVTSVTAEKVPEDDDYRSKMKWFWEPSHYTAAAGNLMLDKIFGYHDPARPLPGDFGLLLDSSSIEPWISRTRESLRRYIADEPGETEIVHNSLEPVIKIADGSNCGHDMDAVIAGSDALQRGDTVTADVQFKRASEIHESERQRYADLGVPFREYAFNDALSRAKTGQIVERRLSNWAAYQARGNERLKALNLAGAVEDFTLAILLGPPNTALYFLRGSTRLQLKDFAGAAEDLDMGLALEPNNQTLKALREQARAGLMNQGLDPNAAAELQRRADEKRKHGDLSGALTDYNDAIRVSPPNTALYYLRGTILLEMGDNSAAREDFRAGLVLEPQNKTLLHLLQSSQK